MLAVLSAIGVLALVGLSLYLRVWLPHRQQWEWDEYEYPARPTGGPSPRVGLDDWD